MDARSEKRPGTVFNVKLRVGEGPDGKAQWQRIGTVFIRADLSGGAAFIGEEGEQRVFDLFPKEWKPKAKLAQSPRANVPEQAMPLPSVGTGPATVTALVPAGAQLPAAKRVANWG